MEGMASVWSYQQSIEELKHELLCTTIELASTQIALEEEKRRNDENEKQFRMLLNAAYQERDETKHQLQMLLNNSTQLTEVPHVVPNLLSEPVPILLAQRSSSITESDGLSETYHQRSHLSSSPVDSIFDPVASSELSNINFAEPINIVAPIQPFHHESRLSSGMSQMDPRTADIYRLAMKKPLPEKGKLVQAVLDAGPLLQALLIAGPLPEWRNPPPPPSSQVPLVSIRGFDSAAPPYPRASSGISRFCSPSMLNSGPVSPCVMKSPSYGFGDASINDSIPMVKRQKFQCLA